MVGHSNLGLRRRAAARRATRRHHLHRDPTRGGSVVRGVGLRQAHRPPGRVRRDCRTRFDQPAHRSVRRQGRPCSSGVAVGPGAVEGARARRVPRPRSRRSVCRRRPVQPRHSIGIGSFRTDGTGREARARRPHGDTPDRARRGAGAAGTDVDGERSDRADRRSPRRPTGCHAAASSCGDRTGGTPGHHRRSWRSRRGRRDRRAGRAPGRAGTHHLQGQGTGTRLASARRRCARSQRYAGGVVVDERGRSPGRRRRIVLEPHRHRSVQADRADRR